MGARCVRTRIQILSFAATIGNTTVILFPVRCGIRWADECGIYGAWMRCTGGGEPMLHPGMVDMVEYAKVQGARVWMNTNGSMFGPTDYMAWPSREDYSVGNRPYRIFDGCW